MRKAESWDRDLDKVTFYVFLGLQKATRQNKEQALRGTQQKTKADQLYPILPPAGRGTGEGEHSWQ